MTADEFASALADVVDSQALLSPVDDARRRVGRRASRRGRRGSVGAAAVVTMTLIAGLVVTNRTREAAKPTIELIANVRPMTPVAEVVETLHIQFERGDRKADIVLAGPQVIDSSTGSALSVLTQNGQPAPRDEQAEQRVVGGVTYTRYSARDRALLGLPTVWVAVDAGPSAPRYVGLQLPSLSPAGVLEHVGNAAGNRYRSVETLGHESVGGLRTTRYRLTVAPDAARTELIRVGVSPQVALLIDARMTTELWVDHSRLLRRTAVVTEEVVPLGDFRARISVEQQVVAYKASAPRVLAPPADQTTWVSAAELSSRFARVDPFMFTD